jgi:hypothetical protein
VFDRCLLLVQQAACRGLVRAPRLCTSALPGCMKLLLSARKLQDYRKQVQRDLGPHVTQEKTERYMRSVTKAKTDLLNPTSRLPVYPSAATITKQSDFGLGHAREDVLAEVAARHKGEQLSPISAIVPRKLRGQVKGDADTAGAQSGSASPEARSKSSPGYKERQPPHAVSEFKHSWQSQGIETAGPTHAANLSKFERRVRACKCATRQPATHRPFLLSFCIQHFLMPALSRLHS